MEEAENTTNLTPQGAHIRDLIKKSGPITFESFMALALYGDCGYYSGGQKVWGKPESDGGGGDYVTNTDISDVFAVMMAKCFFDMWQALESPDEFTLLEAGAGRGTLTLGVIKSTSKKAETDREYKQFLNALSVVMVDRGSAFEDSIEEIDALLAKPVKIYKDISEVESSFVGVIYSNELFDAMPVNLLINKGGLKEVYVEWDLSSESFKEVIKELSNERLRGYFDNLNIKIPEGSKCEVNTHMEGFVKVASRLIDKGYLLTVDYGYPAKVLYDEFRTEGTLLCHYRHKLNDNPYINVGVQDITAHIDFTNLANIGTNEGLDLVGYTTQSNFLLGLGVTEEFGELNPMVKMGEATKADIDMVARNQSIKELVLPGGVGDTFKVMVQGKCTENDKMLKCFSFKDLKEKLF